MTSRRAFFSTLAAALGFKKLSAISFQPSAKPALRPGLHYFVLLPSPVSHLMYSNGRLFAFTADGGLFEVRANGKLNEIEVSPSRVGVSGLADEYDGEYFA